MKFNWMLIKQSVEFIRFDNKVSCECSRRNGILDSSLEKNISLIEEKLGQSNKKWVSSSILLPLSFITWYIVVSTCLNPKFVTAVP